jgi:serine/threonine protein kinase
MTDRSYPFALPAGTDISGYVVESVLGAGGFGITYRARNPVTGVTVAIKEFFPQGLASRQGMAVHLHADVNENSYETALRKFEQEAAKLTGRYRHPNIVRGVNFLKANNTAYFVMEFIAGISLDVYLNAKRQPADETELRHIFEPIFDAVDYIHSLDGMHRDLTPRNIMIRPDGTAILVDFGAAGEGLDTERPYSTAFAQPNYAPPEQIAYDDGRMQGRHTDIFSLAGVLYRAVAGQPPVRPLKRSQEVSIHGGAADPYVPLAEAALAPHFYQPLFFTGIDRALRLDYRERPASIAEFRHALGWDAPTAVYHPSDLYADEPTVALTEPLTRATIPGAVRDEIRAPLDDGFDHLPPPRRSALARLTLAAAVLLGLGIAGAATWMALEPAPPALRPSQPVEAPATPPETTAPSAPRVVTPGPAAPSQPAAPPAVQSPTAPLPPSKPATPPAAQAPAQPPAPAADAGWQEFPGLMPTGTSVQPVAGVEPPKADQCQKACRDDRSCQAYAIERQNCVIFTGVTGLVPDANARSAARPGGAAANLMKSSVERAEQRKPAFRRLEGVALTPPIGAALPVPRGIDSEAACGFACAANAQCKGFDFQADPKSCKLLREVQPDGAAATPGHTAAVEDQDGQIVEAIKRATAPKPRAAQTFDNLDVGGQVLAREPSASSDACRQTCLNDNACVASMYADQLCTRFAQVGDIGQLPGSQVHVDTRQGALIMRLQAALAPPAPDAGAPTQLGQPPTPLGQLPATPGAPGAQPQTPPMPIGPGQPQPPAVAPSPGPRLGQSEDYDGYEVLGSVIAGDTARGARFEEACEAACADNSACVAYTFLRGPAQCRLYGAVQDVTPNASAIAGIFPEAGPTALDAVRRKLSMREINRGNFRPMPAGCGPTGPATVTPLGPSGSAEQCEFLCQGAANCQAWVYSPRDRNCHQLSGITGAVGGVDVRAGILDPSGRRLRDLARACGPIPPAAIGGERPREGGPLFRLPF